MSALPSASMETHRHFCRSRVILVLIGVPGAGKSATAAAICNRVRARHIAIDVYRVRSTPPEDVAENLAKTAATAAVIFECSGASRDFEAILHALAERGIGTCVVALHTSPASALTRVAARDPYEPPKGGQGWAAHVRWCQTRLSLVPTDADVDAEQATPDERAEAAIAAWASVCGSAVGDALPTGTLTFSQLLKWQVCGREYAYRHVWRTPLTDALPAAVAIGEAIHKALAWLFTAERTTLYDLLATYDSGVSALGIVGDDDARRSGRDLLERYFATHHQSDDTNTLGVELPVTLPLTRTLSLSGRLDRLAMNAAGELEVMEFKLRQTRPTSRPRVPELLQPAAYAAAVMASRQRRRAFMRQHYLEQDIVVRELVDESDARAVRWALIRWVRSLARRQLAARPGRHCRHCAWRRICPDRSPAV